MQSEDSGNEPGETIGVSDDVRLDIRPVADDGPSRAVLFVGDDFTPGEAVDIEVVRVNGDTLAEITRKRT